MELTENHGNYWFWENCKPLAKLAQSIWNEYFDIRVVERGQIRDKLAVSRWMMGMNFSYQMCKPTLPLNFQKPKAS